MSNVAETERLRRENREAQALYKQKRKKEKLEKKTRDIEHRKDKREVQDFAKKRGVTVIAFNSKQEYYDPYEKRVRIYEVGNDGRLTPAEIIRISKDVPKKNLQADKRRNARKTYDRPYPRQAAAWERHPGRYDIKGVDTMMVAEPVITIREGRKQTTLFNIRPVKRR